MTVSTLATATDWMATNGTQVNWPYTFALFALSDVRVDVREGLDGAIATYDSNIGLYATDDDEGYVKYPATGDALASGKYVRVRREVAYTQEIAIGNEGRFNADLHERAFDRSVLQAQQLAAAIARQPKYPEGTTGGAIEDGDENELIAFDGAQGFRPAGYTVTQLAAIATAAAASALAALNAKDAVLEAYDHFDDRYLGAKAEAPTLDNDGDALIGGALYFDTVLESMRLWTGSAWVAAYVSDGGFAVLSNNGSDYTAATFRTNLSLYSTAQVDSALTAKAPTANPTFTGTVTVPDGSFGFLKLAAAAFASAAEWLSNTASKILTANAVWAAMAEVPVSETDLTTTGVNLSLGIDFSVTLTASRTMVNFINVKVGQRGRIRVTQDATGGWILTKASNHKTPANAALSLPTDANAEGFLYYDCVSATKILLSSSPLAWS